jgi:formylglycine-generating enzyme required for sulfatase activity
MIRPRIHPGLIGKWTVSISFGVLWIVSGMPAATVSGMKIEPNPDPSLIDIRYDLAANGWSTVAVKLEVSTDGGSSWTLPAGKIQGDLGERVTPGAGKRMIWVPAGDQTLDRRLRLRILADEGFASIPEDRYTIGRVRSDTDSDAPPVTVQLSAFFIQKTETTQAQWNEVRAWALNHGYDDLAAGAGKAANYPIHNVSWYDVVKWCNARSEMDGLTPCYLSGGAVFRSGVAEPSVDWKANGYRLPTEAEWEVAARGGVKGKRFPWGADTIQHTDANYWANAAAFPYDKSRFQIYTFHPSYEVGSKPFTAPVGSFAANGYGLHDMAGNVWEWCWDWYDSSSYKGSVKNPSGPAVGEKRVVRGGSWGTNASRARCSFRYGSIPTFTDFGGGFRCVRGNVALSSTAPLR